MICNLCNEKENIIVSKIIMIPAQKLFHFSECFLQKWTILQFISFLINKDLKTRGTPPPLFLFK